MLTIENEKEKDHATYTMVAETDLQRFLDRERERISAEL